jgi:hypothetical protein
MSTKQPINPDEIEINIREVKDKPGKAITVVFEDCRLLSDIRCLAKDTEKCDKCKLKFRCFTGANLDINFLKELKCQALEELQITLNEAVEAFLRASGGGLDKRKSA